MKALPPDWDVLIGADLPDVAAHDWFPVAKTFTVQNLLPLEGLRFRNVYLTSGAIEHGGPSLFAILYRSARLTGCGKVLHTSDYRENG